MKQEEFKKEIVPLREKLLFYAQRILQTQEDAEDVVQEVMLKLWHIRKELDKYNNVAALAVTITKNLCLNRLKSFREYDNDMDKVAAEYGEPLPDSLLEQQEDVMMVMTILDSLPDLQQTILRMKHIEGLEIEEITELTGASSGAIRVHLSRGRKRIKELFFKRQQ